MGSPWVIAAKWTSFCLQAKKWKEEIIYGRVIKSGKWKDKQQTFFPHIEKFWHLGEILIFEEGGKPRESERSRKKWGRRRIFEPHLSGRKGRRALLLRRLRRPLKSTQKIVIFPPFFAFFSFLFFFFGGGGAGGREKFGLERERWLAVSAHSSPPTQVEGSSSIFKMVSPFFCRKKIFLWRAQFLHF